MLDICIWHFDICFIALEIFKQQKKKVYQHARLKSRAVQVDYNSILFHKITDK